MPLPLQVKYFEKFTELLHGFGGVEDNILPGLAYHRVGGFSGGGTGGMCIHRQGAGRR
jgi:hypothetical protein